MAKKQSQAVGEYVNEELSSSNLAEEHPDTITVRVEDLSVLLRELWNVGQDGYDEFLMAQVLHQYAV